MNVKVLPVSNQQIVVQQPQQGGQQPQVIQTADGQTLIYQPVAVDNSQGQQVMGRANCKLVRLVECEKYEEMS